MDKSKVVYQDEYLIAVDKPVDLPVHKNDFMPHDADYLTKAVGLLTGKPTFPVHRLDSKTSGLILLAFSREMAAKLTQQFEDRSVRKEYMVVCKGLPGEGVYDKDVLIKKKKKRVRARTLYQTIRSIDTRICYKDSKDIRLSLVKAIPETGRWHQLRQHFAFERNDIIGDTQHGDWTLNKLVTHQCGVRRLLLHSHKLTFSHPVSEERMTLEAPVPHDFVRVLEALSDLEIHYTD